jgi:nucleoside-diphosphate-sugar epimerase
LLLEKGLEVVAVDDLSKGDRSRLPEKNQGFSFVLADLREREEALKVIRDCDWVIHLASQAYGVAYCSKNHSSTFLLNGQINANVIEALHKNRVPGMLAASSSCVYSDDVPDGMTEDMGFIGEPERANWGYGWAKRMLEVGVMAAVMDKEFDGLIVRPVNIYGASYGWFGEDSHVIPSLARKLLSGENPIVVWGDGNQARSFVHVRDTAQALLELSLKAPNGTVVNLGDEKAISINELVETMGNLFDVKPQVKHDLTKPVGRKVKSVSSKKFRNILPDFQWKVPIREGLNEMKNWYERHKIMRHF